MVNYSMSSRSFIFVTQLMMYITITLNCVGGKYAVPDLDTEVMISNGDLNLGGLIMSLSPKDGRSCSNIFDEVSYVQYLEAVAHTVEQINNDTKILPNITLGYMAYPTCFRDVDDLGKTMSFISETNTTTNQLYRADGLNRIIGVFGLTTSRQSVMSSPVLSIFNIPHISMTATSDDLSDQSRFEYFLRLVPADRFQTVAMVDIVRALNWTYVSFLYSEGSYGEGAAHHVEKLVIERGICLAYTKRVPGLADEKDFDGIVEGLWMNYKAKIVLLFINYQHAELLVQNLKKRNLHHYFIFVGSDFFRPQLYPNFPGLKVDLLHAVHHDFDQYFRNLKPHSNPYDNPLMDLFWEAMEACDRAPNIPLSLCGFNETDTGTYRYIDAVNVFAHATDRLIRWKCPDAFTNKELLDGCVTGKDLLATLKNGSYPGYLDPIELGSDSMGRYQILQYNYVTKRYIKLGYWSARDGQIESFEIELINWALYDDFPAVNTLPYPQGFPVAIRDENTAMTVPESVCSKPCQEKEYFVQQEVHCCWECRTCRNNEHLLANNSGCETCPSTTWPDDETATLCISIPPTYMKWTDIKAIGLIIMAFLGILSSTIVLCVYLIQNKHKLIKASGRELSYMTLAGIYLAFVTVIPFVAKPNDESCICSRFGFNLSVTLLYGPLLMKTMRIYRIFNAGKKGTKVLRGTGSGFQIILASLILCFQIVLSAVTAVIAPPVAKLRMKIPTEKHVELYCNLPLDGLLAPLTLNILLLLMCAVLGFLTRKLPENFNESWYIFMSVTTTSFLWMLFLPTYFTQFYTYNQAALLAFCLIMNAFVTLISLYVPRIYAIYFVDQDKIKYETKGTVSNTTEATTSKVAPATENTTDAK